MSDYSMNRTEIASYQRSGQPLDDMVGFTLRPESASDLAIYHDIDNLDAIGLTMEVRAIKAVLEADSDGLAEISSPEPYAKIPTWQRLAGIETGSLDTTDTIKPAALDYIKSGGNIYDTLIAQAVSKANNALFEATVMDAAEADLAWAPDIGWTPSNLQVEPDQTVLEATRSLPRRQRPADAIVASLIHVAPLPNERDDRAEFKQRVTASLHFYRPGRTERKEPQVRTRSNVFYYDQQFPDSAWRLSRLSLRTEVILAKVGLETPGLVESKYWAIKDRPGSPREPNFFTGSGSRRHTGIGPRDMVDDSTYQSNSLSRNPDRQTLRQQRDVIRQLRSAVPQGNTSKVILADHLIF